MRLCWVAGVILLAGIGVLAADEIKSVEVAKNQFTLDIQTERVTRCYLVSPAGKTLELIPEDKSGDRFEVNSNAGCSVTVEAEVEDRGIWEMRAEKEDGEMMSQKYQVIVPSEGETDHLEIDDDDESINWLTEIRHVTRVGLEVTITLSKTSHEEECFLRTPESEAFKLGDLRRTGVVDHNGSEFVSCRVVIGPMEEDGLLLGNWALCGRYMEDSVQHMRCQPANIEWNNPSDPNRVWQTTTHPEFEYVVNYGKILSPAISEPRDIITCHIITPYGEDLVVTQESDYPDLTRVPSSSSICSIAIGPIHAGLLGDWTIYAVYASIFGTVEQRRPMHLYLYDNDNPHNQAYNITNLDPIDRIVNLHSTIEMRVITESTETNNCYSKDPSGLVYTTENTTSSGRVSFISESGVCRVFIGPITEDMLGDWLLTGKFRNTRFNNFIERRLPVRLIKEDPANPAEDIPRRIETIAPLRFDTKFNASHTISIRGGSTTFVTYESCHLITPDKLQYIIMEGFHVPGVEVIEDRDLACGVIIHVDADENIGEWTLMSREIVLSTATEKRLPVTIYVEVDVPALPTDVSIGRGNDYYVRLANPTDIYDTCKLVPPEGVEDVVYEIDERFPAQCGYIVRNFKASYGGEWRIVYGHGATYIAKTQVTVIANFEATEIDQQWVRDRPVNVLIGPEDTVYCRVQDPSGFAVFEAFGRCNVVMERARIDHEGTWRMTVMRNGHILTVEQTFTVRVNEPEPRPVVTTSLESGPLDPPNHPYISLSCSVSTEETVRNCKFRDPHGRLFLAVEGVGQEDYQFHGIGISMTTNVRSHDCGLQITNPTTYDLGIWRCAMETERETYYGFVLAVCPYAMSVPAVAEAVVTEPVLAATTQSVSIVEGETATLSCSVQAPIKYCYFRARNGTVYSVSPDPTPLPQEGGNYMRSYHQNPPPNPSPGRPMPFMEYVGAGFDAGDCGIRIPTLRFADTGSWTCHVGFVDSTEPEQSTSIAVNVEEQMAAIQVLEGNMLEVQAVVHGGRQLEYCRFVRMDGLGFTSVNAPDRYIGSSQLSQGLCRITMRDPTILEMHPWTVVARVHGQEFEIARQTPATFPESATTTPPPDATPPIMIITSPSFTWLWVLISMLLLSIFLFGIMLGPRRNRQWTTSRARTFRNSFRNSIQKKPLEDNHVNPQVTPNVNSYVNTPVTA